MVRVMDENRRHPESVMPPAKVDEETVDYYKEQISNAVSSREVWESRLLQNYRKRHGKRREKTFPWPGCSNINIPLIDAKIREAKPEFVNSIFYANPIVTFQTVGGEDPERAHRVEAFYDWLVRYRMRGAWEESNLAVDSVLTYGQAIMKVEWEYETERVHEILSLGDLPQGFDREAASEDEITTSLFLTRGLDPNDSGDAEVIRNFIKKFRAGDEHIPISYTKIAHRAPRWRFVDPRDIIVPWDAQIDVDSLPWISHRKEVTARYVEERIANGYYDKEAGEKVLKAFGKSIGYEYTANAVNKWRKQDQKQVERDREGLHQHLGDTTLVEIHEVYFWYDLDGDGRSERCYMEIDPGCGEVLRLRPFPYTHGQWPFTQLAFERTDRHWYSPRGIPTLLHDISEELNATHNAWIDRMTLQNALTFKYRQGSLRDPNFNRIVPGTGIPVKRMDDLDVLNIPMLDFSFDAQEKVLRAWADDYIGSAQLGFTNTVQRSERRTAAEVDSIQLASRVVRSLDVALYQKAMVRVHKQTYALWLQYGDQEVTIRVDKASQPIRMSKTDLMGSFDLVPTGNLENNSAEQKQQRAMNNMSIAANPTFGQYTNQYEIVRDYFENSPDFRDSDRFLRAPGLFEQDEQQKQLAEIVFIHVMGQVPDVELAENHELHMQVLQQAIPQWQERDEATARLMIVHFGLHLIAMGDSEQGSQVVMQSGFQPQQVGNRFIAVPTQQGGGNGQPAAPPGA